MLEKKGRHPFYIVDLYRFFLVIEFLYLPLQKVRTRHPKTFIFYCKRNTAPKTFRLDIWNVPASWDVSSSIYRIINIVSPHCQYALYRFFLIECDLINVDLIRVFVQWCFKRCQVVTFVNKSLFKVPCKVMHRTNDGILSVTLGTLFHCVKRDIAVSVTFD